MDRLAKLLEAADALLERASEGSLDVAEQLGLYQVLRQRGDVHRDHWQLAARAGQVHRSGDHFLPRAGFAGDEHGGPPGGHQPDDIDRAAQGRARSH